MNRHTVFSDKSRIAELLLGGISFLAFFFVYASWEQGLLFLILFGVAGFIRPHINRPLRRVVCGIWTILLAAFLTVLPLYEIYQDSMWYLIKQHTGASTVILNALLVLSVMLCIFAATAQWRLSVAISSAFLAALTILNGYIYRFRGKEFIFSDIFAAKTAFNVANQYNLGMQQHTFTAVAALLLLLCVILCFPAPQIKRNWRMRLLSLMCSVLLLGYVSFSTQSRSIINWDAEGTLFNGYYLNFYFSIRDYFVKQPENYNEARLKKLEEEYAAEETDAPGELPNILVIMNESYADLRVFGSELKTEKPVMPFMDSLTENTVKGYALSSVLGGTTANSEFEFLTGFTTQFLPGGATPYQQYMHNDSFSLVRLLNTYGYECIATHPYLPSGWNRTNVYPLMGFWDYMFIEAYPGEKLIRNFVSDREMYEYVLSQLQEERSNPLFLFGITMQNHGGYEPGAENFTQTIFLEGYSQEYPLAETYLSLVNQSDTALEYLITELKNYPEDTIILFFGDHLPNLDPGFYQELLQGEFDTLESKQKKYCVPFFIWANFDIAEQTVPCTSLNYLGWRLLESAGLNLPPYYRFLKQMESVVPSINASAYYSVENGTYLPCSEAQGDELDWLETYRIIQYNGMFDKKNLSPVFFGNYMN